MFDFLITLLNTNVTIQMRRTNTTLIEKEIHVHLLYPIENNQ